MKTYFNLLHMALQEQKRTGQFKWFIILLLCIVFMMKVAFFAQSTALLLSANGVDVVSQAALLGLQLLAVCTLIIFLICFTILQLMKIQDLQKQIILLKILGYRNIQITYYCTSVWFFIIAAAALCANLFLFIGGYWILNHIGFTAIDFQLSVYLQAVVYSDSLLFIYTFFLFTLQHWFIKSIINRHFLRR